MRPILLFAFLLTVSAPSVFAKGPKEGKTKTLTDEETFKALDKDGDNLLSKEEFCAPPEVRGAGPRPSRLYQPCPAQVTRVCGPGRLGRGWRRPGPTPGPLNR